MYYYFRRRSSIEWLRICQRISDRRRNFEWMYFSFWLSLAIFSMKSIFICSVIWFSLKCVWPYGVQWIVVARSACLVRWYVNSELEYFSSQQSTDRTCSALRPSLKLIWNLKIIFHESPQMLKYFDADVKYLLMRVCLVSIQSCSFSTDYYVIIIISSCAQFVWVPPLVVWVSTGVEPNVHVLFPCLYIVIVTLHIICSVDASVSNTLVCVMSSCNVKFCAMVTRHIRACFHYSLLLLLSFINRVLCVFCCVAGLCLSYIGIRETVCIQRRFHSNENKIKTTYSTLLVDAFIRIYHHETYEANRWMNATCLRCYHVVN